MRLLVIVGGYTISITTLNRNNKTAQEYMIFPENLEIFQNFKNDFDDFLELNQTPLQFVFNHTTVSNRSMTASFSHPSIIYLRMFNTKI